MLNLTWTAIERLRKLIEEHPEDPVVRITLRDLDDQRLSLAITLEPSAQEEDEVQHIEGLTIALERKSVHRTNGMTVDYQEAKGFSFVHPQANELGLIMPSNN
ncbi:MAG: putative Iron-sulfur cluster assembly protein [Nitrospira sp.]|jgi:Fe-S cluster assembly iron-binding protein IscA|nr:putative Iron-sulfur cluster assembly protein [Nitrospira sp.]